MAFTKHILPVLAFAGAVLGTFSSAGDSLPVKTLILFSFLAQCTGPVEIQNQGDADALASCSTFKGDVTISSVASGNIAIDGVGQITGSLTCQNAGQLTEISADQLGSIGGTFKLYNLTILSTLAFSSLNDVNAINWVGLPALQGLNFPQGVSHASNVIISNTELNTLSGIELETVGNFDINNNPYLNSVNVNEMTNITGSLNFAANADSLSISFPNLVAANNMTFRNAASVSVPSLNRINGSLGFYSNTFSSFSAPNLTSTGGTLAFVDSPNLKNVSMPVLKIIGGGFLINNTALDNIDGFPDLTTIVGALDFAGSFDR